ncbi:MAG: hypothetical protein WC762_14135 [Methylobacter sp.]
MKQMRLFVHIMDQVHNSESTVAKAIKMVVTPLQSCAIVDKLVDENDVEADVAIVDESSQALRFIKETEKTTVVISYLMKDMKLEAEALAARYPGRVLTWCYVAAKGEPDFFIKLATLINEKAKEES